MPTSTHEKTAPAARQQSKRPTPAQAPQNGDVFSLLNESQSELDIMSDAGGSQQSYMVQQLQRRIGNAATIQLLRERGLLQRAQKDQPCIDCDDDSQANADSPADMLQRAQKDQPCIDCDDDSETTAETPAAMLQREAEEDEPCVDCQKKEIDISNGTSPPEMQRQTVEDETGDAVISGIADMIAQVDTQVPAGESRGERSAPGGDASGPAKDAAPPPPAPSPDKKEAATDQAPAPAKQAAPPAPAQENAAPEDTPDIGGTVPDVGGVVPDMGDAMPSGKEVVPDMSNLMDEVPELKDTSKENEIPSGMEDILAGVPGLGDSPDNAPDTGGHEEDQATAAPAGPESPAAENNEETPPIAMARDDQSVGGNLATDTLPGVTELHNQGSLAGFDFMLGMGDQFGAQFYDTDGDFYGSDHAGSSDTASPDVQREVAPDTAATIPMNIDTMPDGADMPVQRWGILKKIGKAVSGAVKKVAKALDPRKLLDKLIGALESVFGGGTNQANAKEMAGKKATSIQDAKASQQEGKALQSSAKKEQGAAKLASKAQSQAAAIGSKAQAGSQKIEQKSQESLRAVEGIGPAMAPLKNPALAIVDPGKVDSMAGEVGNLSQQASKESPGSIPENISKAIKDGLGPDGQWDCDKTEVVAIASGVARSVLDPLVNTADRLSGGRVSKLIKFGKEVGERLGKVASILKTQIGKVAKKVKQFIGKITGPIIKGVKQAVTRVFAKIGQAAKAIKDGFVKLGKAIAKGWDALKTGVTKFAKNFASNFKRGMQAVVGKIKGLLSGAIGAVMKLLPKSWQNAAKRMADTFTKAAKRVADGFVALGKQLKATAQRVGQMLKQGATKALQGVGEAVKFGKKVVKKGKEAIKSAAKKAYNALPAPIRKGIDKVGGAIGWAVGKVKDGVEWVKKKLAQFVCTPVNQIAGPCVEQYLPFKEGETESSVELKTGMELSVPLHEIGVPANAKVAKDSSLKLSRVDEKKYEVEVNGEARIAATEEIKEPADLDASFTLPDPKAQHAADVLKQLKSTNGGGGGGSSSGGSGGGNGPAKSNGNSGGGGANGAKSNGSGGSKETEAGGPGVDFSAEAGIKTGMSSKFAFEIKDNSCDLLAMGGLMLSAGVGQALEATPGIGSMIGPLLQQATNAIFYPYLQEVKFTQGVYGKISGEADLGIAEGEGSLEGFYGTSTGLVRDEESGEMKPRMELIAGLSGELAAKTKGLDFLNAAAQAEGQAILGIEIDEKTSLILPTDFAIAAQGRLEVGGMVIDLLPAMIPEAAKNAIMEKITFLKKYGVTNINFEMSYKVEKLETLVAKLDEYFSLPAEQISADGLWAVIMAYLDELEHTFSFKLTTDDASNIGAQIGGGAAAGGANLEAGASASASRTITSILFEGEYKI